MKIENICNFYASKYHLSVVLFEYLRRNSKKKVITFFEEGIEEEIKALEDVTNQDIKSKVNFSSNINIEDTEIDECRNIVFLLRGSNNYLKEANMYIKEELRHMKGKAKIVNCYDFEQQRSFMKNIIKGSDKILYTTGEKIID